MHFRTKFLLCNDFPLYYSSAFVGCASNIVHNGVHCSSDIVPVGIESTGNKLFPYLHMYTVRVEELKVFCL